MMRVLVGLTVCLVGCAFDHGSLDNPGDTGGSGSGSGSAQPGDFDGDGVPDLVDNCNAAANADQRDHDGDGRGDACDVCPHLPDAGADSDGDGVGDACDPNPQQATDRIALFDGFYDQPMWNTVLGPTDWQVSGGILRQQQLDAAQLVHDESLGTVFVDARVQVNSMATNPTTRRSVGIILGFGDKDHYFFCGVAQEAASADVQAGAESTDYWGSAQYNYAPGAFDSQINGGWLTLQATSSPHDWDAGTHIDCMSHRASRTGTAAYDDDGTPSGDIGLRTNGVDASFDYVFVVETHPGDS